MEIGKCYKSKGQREMQGEDERGRGGWMHEEKQTRRRERENSSYMTELQNHLKFQTQNLKPPEFFEWH